MQEAATENGEIDLFETPESIETGLDNNADNKMLYQTSSI
mgnify:CR=1 FL=1